MLAFDFQLRLTRVRGLGVRRIVLGWCGTAGDVQGHRLVHAANVDFGLLHVGTEKKKKTISDFAHADEGTRLT